VSLVLVVARDPSLALALRGTGLDVVELRPAGLEAWLGQDERPAPDAVVVSQAAADDALATLHTVRDHGVAAAALLLASGGQAWAELDPGLPPATRLLVLPVGGLELIQAVHEVIATPDSYVGAHVAPAAVPERSPDPEPAPDPASSVPDPRPAVAHVIDLRAGEGDERVSDVRTTVGHLLERVDDVYGVPESARVVVAEAQVRVRADAAALLVADNERWRLAAAEGLREEETGDVLAPSAWVTSTIGPARRGLVVDASPLARERIQGIPLAGRRHLVVAPVPPARAVLVLARDEGPDFTDADVTTLVELGEEAGPLLAAAADARALARALAHLRDIEAIPDRVDSSG
jgi:hypothetical protein